MSALIQVLAFVITILVLVSVHEAGHFFVAKLLGIKVSRYAIGFGKPLIRYRSKQGTEYILGLIPLGGYVKLLDEREVAVPEAEKPFAFNRKPLWARTLVVLAGPAMNLLFAVIGFWLMFAKGIEVYRPIVGETVANSIAAHAGLKKGDEIVSINQKPTPSLQKVVVTIIEHLGETGPLILNTHNIYSQKNAIYTLDLRYWVTNALNPDPLKSLGLIPIRPALPAIIGGVDAGTPAAYSGLRANDHIIAINQQPVKDWYQFVDYIKQHPLKKVAITYQRDGKTIVVDTTIGKQYSFGSPLSGFLGVRPLSIAIPHQFLKLRKYPYGQALLEGAKETWQFLAFNYIVIKKMVRGKISLSTLGGPITLFETADQAFEQGAGVFFGFLAIISIMLGFINLLPIPGLDGGHLLNFLIEFIIRRPLSLKFELISIRIGLLLLLTFMLLATFNDIMRIISSL